MAQEINSSSESTWNEGSENIVIPVTKLDAEQYMADDLDGVTESVFGSGNMSYAALQASQTNAMIAENNLTMLSQEGNPLTEALASEGNGVDLRDAGLSYGNGDMGRIAGREENATNADRALGEVEPLQAAGGNAAEANFTTTTAGAISDSQHHSGQGFSETRSIETSTTVTESTNATNGKNGVNGTGSGTNGTSSNGTNGINGTNGKDGKDAVSDPDDDNPGSNDDDTDIGSNIGIDLTEVLNQINDIVAVAGDAVAQVTDAVTNITQVLDTLASELLNGTGLDINAVTDVVTNLTEDLTQTVEDTVGQILDMKNDITDALEGVLTGNGSVGDVVDAATGALQDVLSGSVVSDVLGVTQQLTELAGIDMLDEALGTLGNATQELQQELQDALGQISGTVSTLTEVQNLSEAIGELAAVTDTVTATVDDAVGGVLGELGLGEVEAVEQVMEFIDTAETAVMDTLEPVEALTEAPLEAIEQIVQDPGEAVAAVTELLSGATEEVIAAVDADTIDEVAETVMALLSEASGGATAPVSELAEEAVGGITEEVIPVAEPIITVVEEATGQIQEVADAIAEDVTSLTDQLLPQEDADMLEDTLQDTIATVLESAQPMNEVVDAVLEGTEDSGVGTLTETAEELTEILQDIPEEGLTGIVEMAAIMVETDGLEGITEIVDMVGEQPELSLGAEENILDSVEDVLGDIDTALGLNIAPLDTSAIDNTNGDQDLVLTLDANQAGEDATGLTIDIPLDSVEALMGDIDLDLTGALDALGQQADALIDNGEGGSGEHSTLSGVGDLVEEVLAENAEPFLAPLEEILPEAIAVDEGGLAEVVAPLEEITEILQDIPEEGLVDITEMDDLENITEILDTVSDLAELPLASEEDAFAPVEEILEIIAVDNEAGGTGEETSLVGISEVVQDIVTEILPNLAVEGTTEPDIIVDVAPEIVDTQVADSVVEAVLDPVEDVVGDIDTEMLLATDILNTGETTGEADDTDLALDIDLDIGGVDVLDIVEDISLDDIEAITGDIDLELSSVLDILGDDEMESITESSANDNESSWTESTIDEVGGLFDDIAGGISGLEDTLPDPIGTVEEGLGALQINPPVMGGFLRGLFG